MSNSIPLPPQHANAPTPRTDALVGQWANFDAACEIQGNTPIAPLTHKEHAKQLEREQGYMMEVLELFESAGYCTCESGNKCCSCKASEAYNNLKAYMEQKK